MTYLRALAEKFVEHDLDLGKLDAMDDEEIIKELTSVKGVGRWTAEMFLIFSLGRPDILPVDDLGVRKGAQKTYGLPELPKAAELLSLGERWRPYRSIATWYLWRSLGVALPTGDGSAGPVLRP
jgi:DNA-3-methyladenine glycosylase II